MADLDDVPGTNVLDDVPVDTGLVDQTHQGHPLQVVGHQALVIWRRKFILAEARRVNC